MFRLLLALVMPVLMAFPSISNAQRNCEAANHLQEQIEDNPSILEEMDRIEQHTQNFIADYNSEVRNVVTIPVVVHVIYKTNSENISDAQVLSQIDVLNEDFRRTNSDADNMWSQAADSEIQFCMATIDPSGNATNGITRKSTTKKSFRTNDDMKKSAKGGVDPWNTSNYLNIWVCNLSNNILGYAQFPGGSSATDGVVVLYSAFGRVGTLSANFNLGRTTTHEVGHWLNLRHIWGDGGCSVDDFVSDTPASDGANYGCASSHVSCSSLDMVQNYMDYSDDACMNLFTAGQAARMQAVLAPGGFHHSLTQSTACSGSGPTPTCSDNIMNGDETGVDCGGSCAPCPTATCSDNIMNGDETGVDCGGSSCAPCSTGSCDAPSGLYSTSRKGGREARLTWDAVGAANDYTVQLRQAGASTWSTGTSSGTQLDATGLTKNVAYEWQVRSNCGSSNSAYASSTFTAGQSGRDAGNSLDVNIFPNPTRDILNIQINDLATTSAGISLSENTSFEAETFTVSVIDVLGRTHSSQVMDDMSEDISLDVSSLSNGLYFLKIETADGIQQVERFMVRK